MVPESGGCSRGDTCITMRGLGREDTGVRGDEPSSGPAAPLRGVQGVWDGAGELTLVSTSSVCPLHDLDPTEFCYALTHMW